MSHTTSDPPKDANANATPKPPNLPAPTAPARGRVCAPLGRTEASKRDLPLTPDRIYAPHTPRASLVAVAFSMPLAAPVIATVLVSVWS
jgi:hypothetical protein